MVTGESVATKHWIVGCRMILLVRKRKRPKVEDRIKWWKLKKEDCWDNFRS